MTFNDRKLAIEKSKAESTCRICGQRGHWAGDLKCPKRQPQGHFPKDKPGHTPLKKKSHPPKDKASKKPFSRGRPAGMLAVADYDLHTEEQSASVPELGEEQSASVPELGVACASNKVNGNFVPEPGSPRPRRSVPHMVSICIYIRSCLGSSMLKP